VSPTLFNTVPTLRSQYQHTAQHFTSVPCLMWCPRTTNLYPTCSYFYYKNAKVTLFLSMPTRHIGTDVIHHTLLNVAFGGEWSTSPSGRCVPGEAFRHPPNRMRDGPHRRFGRHEEDKNVAIRRDSNPGSLSPYPSTYTELSRHLITDCRQLERKSQASGSLKISRRAIVWFYKLQGKQM